MARQHLIPALIIGFDSSKESLRQPNTVAAPSQSHLQEVDLTGRSSFPSDSGKDAWSLGGYKVKAAC
jgi:hypothetical protein